MNRSVRERLSEGKPPLGSALLLLNYGYFRNISILFQEFYTQEEWLVKAFMGLFGFVLSPKSRSLNGTKSIVYFQSHIQASCLIWLGPRVGTQFTVFTRAKTRRADSFTGRPLKHIITCHISRHAPIHNSSSTNSSYFTLLSCVATARRSAKIPPRSAVSNHAWKPRLETTLGNLIEKEKVVFLWQKYRRWAHEGGMSFFMTHRVPYAFYHSVLFYYIFEILPLVLGK